MLTRQVIWCQGTYASGSTWLFNALRAIVQTSVPVGCLASDFVSKQCELIRLLNRAPICIAKTHDVRHDTAELMLQSEAGVYVTIRDPRDSVTSLMLYQDYPFDDALDAVAESASGCHRACGYPHATLFRYEANFIGDPLTLKIVADKLGVPLPPCGWRQIIEDLSRPRLEAFLRDLGSLPTVVEPDPGHLVDVATQWHSHHANRTGEIGRWRHMLGKREVRAVEDRLEAWMARFGYPLSGQS